MQIKSEVLNTYYRSVTQCVSMQMIVILIWTQYFPIEAFFYQIKTVSVPQDSTLGPLHFNDLKSDLNKCMIHQNGKNLLFGNKSSSEISRVV